MPPRTLAAMGELIPLFPLGTPLFPGVVLPLHDLRAALPPADARPAGPARRRRPPVLRRGRDPAGLGGRAGRAGRGALRRRLHRARAAGRAPSRTAASAIVTVGADRFRLLDVVVGDGPALPAGRGRVAGRGGGRRGGRRRRRRAGRPGRGWAPARDDVVAAVARGSLDLLAATCATCSPGTWPRSCGAGSASATRCRRRPDAETRRCCSHDGAPATRRPRCPAWWRPRRCSPPRTGRRCSPSRRPAGGWRWSPGCCGASSTLLQTLRRGAGAAAAVRHADDGELTGRPAAGRSPSARGAGGLPTVRGPARPRSSRRR